MKAKVITIKDYEGVSEGSVFNGTLKDGVWYGIATDRCGSYEAHVPMEYVEIWEEKKHNAVMFYARQHLAEQQAIRIEQEERAELARLKAKYEETK